MTPTLSARYANWKAPADDGQVLLWPLPDQLLRDTESNLRRLNATREASIQGVPLADLRRDMRAWVGHVNNDRPLIAMGHQTELYHAGVWAKNALADAMARKLGGRAVQFAVDTDEPKHLKLKWPGGAVPLADDEATADWSGLLPVPSPAHLARVSDLVAAAAARWNFRPLLPEFLTSMRGLSPGSAGLSAALMEAMHELDVSLGLRHHASLFSPICAAEPYLLFAHHVLSRADAFATDYNGALADYRRENRVRTPGRPMPDLKISRDDCEVPFWLDSLSTGTRTRATVLRRADRWVLRAPTGSEFAFHADAAAPIAATALAAWLGENHLRLAPRALTLTTVLRLLIVDQFVHGIGGGRYDQVTDRLLASHFGLEPPRFAVTTATLYFPQSVGRSRVCLSCVIQKGHRLRHRVLGAEKDKLVAAIFAAPRHSLERSTLYHTMHGRLAAAAGHPDLLHWEQEFADASRREQEEEDLFDRELFYAIQSRERLEYLVEHYRTQLAL